MKDSVVFNLDELDISGQFGKYKKWSEECSSNEEGSCCITFEALCREDFHVGISPECRSTSEMYEIVGGAHGNTEAILRRRPQDSVAMATSFCGRICSSLDYKPYWILLKEGVLAFGIGTEVGHNILVKSKDPCPLKCKYVAFSSWRAPVRYKNISITNSDKYESIDIDAVEPLLFFNSTDGGDQALSDQVLDEYRQACERAAKRATRFGAPYVIPDIKSFLPTQEVRRMQRSGAVEPGYVTGFDITTDAEKAKQKARMDRFSNLSSGNEFESTFGKNVNEGMAKEVWGKYQNEQSKMEIRIQKFGIVQKDNVDLRAQSEKVRNERCDINKDSILRNDALVLYSLDNHFQKVRTGDILGYFDGYGPSYVEWINDSCCIVVFEDRYTAVRAFSALSDEIPQEDLSQNTKDDEMQMNKNSMDSSVAPIQMSDIEKKDSSVEMSDMGEKSDSNNVSTLLREGGWKIGTDIRKKGTKETWRILLRLAAEDDFPMEKKPKHLKRKNGHRGNPWSELSSRKERFSSSSSSSSSRKERYYSGQKRSNRYEKEEIDEDQRERINKTSKRIHINDDGSISMRRNDVTDRFSNSIEQEDGDAMQDV